MADFGVMLKHFLEIQMMQLKSSHISRLPGKLAGLFLFNANGTGIFAMQYNAIIQV